LPEARYQFHNKTIFTGGIFDQPEGWGTKKAGSIEFPLRGYVQVKEAQSGYTMVKVCQIGVYKDLLSAIMVVPKLSTSKQSSEGVRKISKPTNALFHLVTQLMLFFIWSPN